jgi:hypothetical protein
MLPVVNWTPMSWRERSKWAEPSTNPSMVSDVRSPLMTVFPFVSVTVTGPATTGAGVSVPPLSVPIAVVQSIGAALPPVLSDPVAVLNSIVGARPEVERTAEAGALDRHPFPRVARRCGRRRRRQVGDRQRATRDGHAEAT